MRLTRKVLDVSGQNDVEAWPGHVELLTPPFIVHADYAPSARPILLKAIIKGDISLLAQTWSNGRTFYVLACCSMFYPRHSKPQQGWKTPTNP